MTKGPSWAWKQVDPWEWEGDTQGEGGSATGCSSRGSWGLRGAGCRAHEATGVGQPSMSHSGQGSRSLGHCEPQTEARLWVSGGDGRQGPQCTGGKPANQGKVLDPDYCQLQTWAGPGPSERPLYPCPKPTTLLHPSLIPGTQDGPQTQPPPPGSFPLCSHLRRAVHLLRATLRQRPIQATCLEGKETTKAPGDFCPSSGQPGPQLLKRTEQQFTGPSQAQRS